MEKMKTVVLVDEVSGIEDEFELEPIGVAAETLIELKKRNFAGSLVWKEWFEKGLADVDLERGFFLKNASETLLLQCEMIEREKKIVVKKSSAF